MFDKLSIHNFRGIRESFIDGLKNVNLFFGKNNCGKSTVLDAIFLICGQSNPALPISINFFRGYQRISRKDLKIDFYQLDDQEPIRLFAEDGESRSLDITVFESGVDQVQFGDKSEESLSSQVEKRFGLRMNYQVDGKPYLSQLEIDASDVNKAVSKIDEHYREGINCLYLSPKFDFFASIQGLVNIIQNKDERFILDALQLIEPQVVDFVFTGAEMLVDIGLKERIPINLLGDGARKMVSILTAIYNSKDGVVLIDEIDNGFHHSVMKDLWRILLSASQRNNTQVFATTHDLDSIIGLIRAAKETNTEGSVSSYRLQKLTDGVLKPYQFSVDSLDYAVQQKIEIR